MAPKLMATKLMAGIKWGHDDTPITTSQDRAEACAQREYVRSNMKNWDPSDPRRDQIIDGRTLPQALDAVRAKLAAAQGGPLGRYTKHEKAIDTAEAVADQHEDAAYDAAVAGDRLVRATAKFVEASKARDLSSVVAQRNTVQLAKELHLGEPDQYLPSASEEEEAAPVPAPSGSKGREGPPPPGAPAAKKGRKGPPPPVPAPTIVPAAPTDWAECSATRQAQVILDNYGKKGLRGNHWGLLKAAVERFGTKSRSSMNTLLIKLCSTDKQSAATLWKKLDESVAAPSADESMAAPSAEEAEVARTQAELAAVEEENDAFMDDMETAVEELMAANAAKAEAAKAQEEDAAQAGAKAQEEDATQAGAKAQEEAEETRVPAMPPHLLELCLVPMRAGVLGVVCGRGNCREHSPRSQQQVMKHYMPGGIKHKSLATLAKMEFVADWDDISEVGTACLCSGPAGCYTCLSCGAHCNQLMPFTQANCKQSTFAGTPKAALTTHWRTRHGPPPAAQRRMAAEAGLDATVPNTSISV